LELLAVVAIMGIVFAFVVPSVAPMLSGSNLTQSGDMVSGQLTFARQSAIASNRRVQVRFYNLPIATGTNSYSAVQIFRVEDSGSTTALTKLQVLRPNVVFAADTAHSTLLVPPAGTVPSVSGTDRLAAYANKPCGYIGFQYLPDGSTDLNPTAAVSAGGWFVTLVPTNKPVPNGQPPNFCSFQVDPINGWVQAFRP
jgi:uncharacterized protein (TIGR02596 family)